MRIDLHWVVKNTIHDFLVWTNQCRITVVYLTNTVDSSGSLKASPEVFLNFIDRVDAQSVNFDNC